MGTDYVEKIAITSDAYQYNWVVTTGLGHTGSIVRKIPLGTSRWDMSESTENYGSGSYFSVDEGVGGGSLNHDPLAIVQLTSQIERGNVTGVNITNAESENWAVAKATAQKAIQAFVNNFHNHDYVGAQEVSANADLDAKVVANMPALQAINDSPGYLKYPLAFGYSLQNKITFNSLQKNDFRQSQLDVQDPRITFSQAKSGARWDIGKGSVGIVLTFSAGAGKYEGIYGELQGYSSELHEVQYMESQIKAHTRGLKDPYGKSYVSEFTVAKVREGNWAAYGVNGGLDPLTVEDVFQLCQLNKPSPMSQVLRHAEGHSLVQTNAAMVKGTITGQNVQMFVSRHPCTPFCAPTMDALMGNLGLGPIKLTTPNVPNGMLLKPR